MKTKKNLYLLGLCAIPVGILLGRYVNKWLGIGIIVLGAIFAIVCLHCKSKTDV